MFYEQVKELAAEEFKRLTGVKAETFAVMVEMLREAGFKKRKSGRPSKLSVENQVLMTLMYLRENRTYFHIALTYRLDASSAFRIIRRVEDTLSKAEIFSLSGKRRVQEGGVELSFVVVDVTETPIERPKKSSDSSIVVRRSATPSTGIARP